MNSFPLITALTLVPFLGGVFLAGIQRASGKGVRCLALAASFVSLVLALVMWRHFHPASGAFQFEERHTWIPSLGIEYRVAVDGLGLLMVLLTAIVTPMAILASRNLTESTQGTTRLVESPLYYSLILFLQAGLF